VQVLAHRTYMANPIKLVPEIQPAPLEVTDHQIVAGTRRHDSANFIFKRLLPPFEISKVVWFCHGMLPTRAPPSRRAENRDTIFDLNQTALLTLLRFDSGQLRLS
jgi:hypothetical protein